MGTRVVVQGDIDKDLVATHLDGESAHIIGKLVKGAAGGEIKTRVVPVAGEDAILHRTFVEREAHVRTAIVHAVDFVSMFKERNRVTVDLDGEQAGLAQLGQTGGAHKVRCGGSHRFLLSGVADKVQRAGWGSSMRIAYHKTGTFSAVL